jgi:nicotinamidase-related amidase
MLVPDDTVLLPIDVQLGFDSPSLGTRNNPRAEANGLRLVEAWRRAGRPIVHVRHDSVHAGSPLHPSSPGNGFKPGYGPRDGEWLVAKSVNSAFIGTDLELKLRRLGARNVAVFGLVTDQCVSTTARMAANLGYGGFVVADACAAFGLTGHDGVEVPAEALHRAHLATLHAEFLPVVDTDEVIAALAGRAAA